MHVNNNNHFSRYSQPSVRSIQFGILKRFSLNYSSNRSVCSIFVHITNNLRIVNSKRTENETRNMAFDQPKLIFKHLKGFQAIDNGGRIKTILFLNAAREVVSIIGELNFYYILLLFRNSIFKEI